MSKLSADLNLIIYKTTKFNSDYETSASIFPYKFVLYLKINGFIYLL